jgi:hypothetical protein
VFEERLRATFPLRAEKVLNALREMRGGRLNNAAFGERMRGEGARYDTIRQLFALHCRKLGLSTERLSGVHEGAAQSEPAPRQRELF